MLSAQLLLEFHHQLHSIERVKFVKFVLEILKDLHGFTALNVEFPGDEVCDPLLQDFGRVVFKKIRFAIQIREPE